MAESEIVYGIHAVRHALTHAPLDTLEMWVKVDWHSRGISEIRTLATRHGVAIQAVQPNTLDKLAQGGQHQGVVLRRRAPKAHDEKDLETLLAQNATAPRLILVLDGVQDPHNLGACLRTADAASVDAVVIPIHRGVGLNATVRKVASGAAETVFVVGVRNLARALRAMGDAGICLVGTEGDAKKDIYDVDMIRPTALILGSEDRGLRHLTREHCDILARIPTHGNVESLNVSVSAGICLFEALRQRRR